MIQKGAKYDVCTNLVRIGAGSSSNFRRCLTTDQSLIAHLHMLAHFMHNGWQATPFQSGEPHDS
jgi:hypothetical protein